MNEIKEPKKPLMTFWTIAMIFLILLNLIAVPLMQNSSIHETDYGTFMKYTQEKKIDQVEIRSNKILFTLKDDDTSSSDRFPSSYPRSQVIYETGLMNDDGLVQRLYDAGVTFSSEIIEQQSPVISFLLYWILPIILIGFFTNFLRRKMMKNLTGSDSMTFGGGFPGIGGMGKSSAKVYVKSSDVIKFADVAGEEEAKENLQEIVTFLKNPAQYQEIGAKMPKGVLLVGPPGTGKTMLAKAVAGEADVPFFSISGSEFVEMFVGMGAAKVRDLFKQAKEKAPCIVFIDEIDAIGGKRSAGSGYGGNDEREQTLNQLLTEMDGFEGNTGVIILAATNRPESLDAALTRPGRFDRRVPVELPDLKGREDILKVHAKKIKIADDVDFNKIARMAAGASGAELAILSTRQRCVRSATAGSLQPNPIWKNPSRSSSRAIRKRMPFSPTRRSWWFLITKSGMPSSPPCRTARLRYRRLPSFPAPAVPLAIPCR